MSQKFNVGIVGASGYTGAELMRLLLQHSEFKLAHITANSQAGKSLADIHPHLAASYPGLKAHAFGEIQQELLGCDLVFLALPHGESMSAMEMLEKAPLVIDLGGDFRLKDAGLYEKWYQHEHHAAELLANFEYGLPELFRERLKKAKRIANPGCYPTAVSLALAPLLAEKLIDPDLTAVCVSGTSGAGKGLKDNLHFSHADENVYAYRLGSHQHTPEIEQVLSEVAGQPVKVSFTPHVVPLSRGIHATMVCNLAQGVSSESIEEALNAAYSKEKFVSILNTPPSTKQVRGSNQIALHAQLDHRLGKVIVTSVIDNLVKGAAGQAIQNANNCLGLPEETGLSSAGFYP